MPIIVISYRRQDSNDIARRIYEALKVRYGEKSVYIDIESIQPSADYRVHIRQTLERALVMLAVIGTQWRGVRPDGGARIFDPDDPVRDEVETMLANRRAVMPVLVNGAAMPSDSEFRQASCRSAIDTPSRCGRAMNFPPISSACFGRSTR